MSLSAIADARNAIDRLYGVFEAETLSETKVQDENMKNAIEIIDAEFVWDGPPPDAPAKKDKKNMFGMKKSSKKEAPAPDAEKSQESTFRLKDVNLKIPEGQLTAIVGMYTSFAEYAILADDLVSQVLWALASLRFCKA